MQPQYCLVVVMLVLDSCLFSDLSLPEPIYLNSSELYVGFCVSGFGTLDFYYLSLALLFYLSFCCGPDVSGLRILDFDCLHLCTDCLGFWKEITHSQAGLPSCAHLSPDFAAFCPARVTASSTILQRSVNCKLICSLTCSLTRC